MCREVFRIFARYFFCILGLILLAFALGIQKNANSVRSVANRLLFFWLLLIRIARLTNELCLLRSE